eukprot:SAG22_NODE_663_length_8042_cov_12.157371_5_plen_329_part_00
MSAAQRLDHLAPAAWLAAVAGETAAQAPAAARTEIARLADSLRDVSEMQRPGEQDAEGEQDAMLPLYKRTVQSLSQLLLQHAVHSHSLQLEVNRLTGERQTDQSEHSGTQASLREKLDASLAVASKTAAVAAEWQARAKGLEAELAALTARHKRLADGTKDMLAIRAKMPPLPVFADDHPGDTVAAAAGASAGPSSAAAAAAGSAAAGSEHQPVAGTAFVVNPSYSEPTLRIWRGDAGGSREPAEGDDVVAIIDNEDELTAGQLVMVDEERSDAGRWKVAEGMRRVLRSTDGLLIEYVEKSQGYIYKVIAAADGSTVENGGDRARWRQ